MTMEASNRRKRMLRFCELWPSSYTKMGIRRQLAKLWRNYCVWLLTLKVKVSVIISNSNSARQKA